MVRALEIENAVMSHAVWKDRLNKAIQTGSPGMPVEVIAADNRCAFGKWLHSLPPSADTGASPYFAEVRRLHAEFHRMAGRVAQLAADGKRDEARALLESDQEYERLSAELSRALLAWRESLRRPDPVR